MGDADSIGVMDVAGNDTDEDTQPNNVKNYRQAGAKLCQAQDKFSLV